MLKSGVAGGRRAGIGASSCRSYLLPRQAVGESVAQVPGEVIAQGDFIPLPVLLVGVVDHGIVDRLTQVHLCNR